MGGAELFSFLSLKSGLAVVVSVLIDWSSWGVWWGGVCSSAIGASVISSEQLLNHLHQLLLKQAFMLTNLNPN